MSIIPNIFKVMKGDWIKWRVPAKELYNTMRSDGADHHEARDAAYAKQDELYNEGWHDDGRHEAQQSKEEKKDDIIDAVAGVLGAVTGETAVASALSTVAKRVTKKGK